MVFEAVVQNLQALGFFNFLLPFMLSAAVFYGLLRRSKVFGEPEKNIAVNAIVAIVASMFVWAYPVLAGVDVEGNLSKFFFQSTIIVMVFVVGLMIAGMFFPEDLSRQIAERLKGKSIVVILGIGIMLAATALIASGLTGIEFPAINLSGPSVSSDMVLTLAVLVILGVSVVAIAGFGNKKS
jgi:hypothetical protein